MRKIILVLLFVFSLGTSLQAQDTFFNDSLRKQLKQFLVDRDIAGWPELYDKYNLSIYNEIRKENIKDNPQAGEYKYGIYSFWGDQFPAFGEILIRRSNDYEILEMLDGMSLMEIMTELIAYFSRHPDIPKALFPLYVDAVSRVYHLNTHWEGAFNVKKKRNISEYGDFSDKDTIYHIIEDSEGELEFHID